MDNKEFLYELETYLLNAIENPHTRKEIDLITTKGSYSKPDQAIKFRVTDDNEVIISNGFKHHRYFLPQFDDLDYIHREINHLESTPAYLKSYVFYLERLVDSKNETSHPFTYNAGPGSILMMKAGADGLKTILSIKARLNGFSLEKKLRQNIQGRLEEAMKYEALALSFAYAQSLIDHALSPESSFGLSANVFDALQEWQKMHEKIFSYCAQLSHLNMKVSEDYKDFFEFLYWKPYDPKK